MTDMNEEGLPGTTESHPFGPFLPENARILMLGSFPPQPKRWCIDFYYPNFINDMWRVFGLVFFQDKDHFIIHEGKPRFDKEAIVRFCNEKGVAFFDTATRIRRLKDNASDKFLEVVTPTDIPALLSRIPDCKAIVTTGEKATEVLVSRYCDPQNMHGPAVGSEMPIRISGPAVGIYRFFRMPSTSRAYPLPLQKKAEAYRAMFESLDMLQEGSQQY